MNTLRADSLTLEPQVAAHAVEMFSVLTDPAIYEFENSPPESADWLARRFEMLESRTSSDGSEEWLNWVARLQTGALAGYVQATISHERVAHIAYVLGSKHWRRGIGTAAVGAMLVELAATYGVGTCVATLKARNHRSLALLRSLKFEPYAGDGCGVLEHGHDEIIMHKRLG